MIVEEPHKGLRELVELHARCNQLFNHTEGKPDNFKYVKKILANGIEKLSTKSKASSFTRKQPSITRFTSLNHPRVVVVGNPKLAKIKGSGKVDSPLSILSDLYLGRKLRFQSRMFALFVGSLALQKKLHSHTSNLERPSFRNHLPLIALFFMCLSLHF